LCGSHNLATRGEQHAGSERAPAKVGKQGRRSDCSRRLTAWDAPARNWRRAGTRPPFRPGPALPWTRG
jgi:hypothetical protein